MFASPDQATWLGLGELCNPLSRPAIVFADEDQISQKLSDIGRRGAKHAPSGLTQVLRKEIATKAS
jgi:hypothetical protein